MRRKHIYMLPILNLEYTRQPKKKYKQMALLQDKLLYSSASQHFILFEAIKNIGYSICNPQQIINKIYLVDKNPSHDKNMQVAHSSHDSTQLTRMILENILEQMDELRLLLVLESEIKAKQDTLRIFFKITCLRDLLSIFNTNFINQSSEKYYFKSINIMSYFKSLNAFYIISRLDISKVLQARLRKSLTSKKWSEYLNSIHNKIFVPKNIWNKFMLHATVVTFLLYCLCLEAIYLSQSIIYSSSQLLSVGSSCFVMTMGPELLFWSNEENTVYLWHQAFNALLNYSSITQITMCNSLPLHCTRGVNFSGYFLYPVTNMIIVSTPSLNAQILLMQQVNTMFLRSKGNSEERLICSLNNLLFDWGSHFIDTNAYKIFALIDYLIYLKVRSWIFKRHTNWGRNKIIKKYFHPSGQKHANFNSKWMLHTNVNNQLIILLKLRHFKYINKAVI